MLQIGAHVQDFFRLVRDRHVEIYNEFSLQHELGMHLRSVLPASQYKVQFERPVEFFGISSVQLPKKEIDIAVFSPDRSCRIAIELKFPRNGQYPEQMFKACQDLAFLEQLVAVGFDSGFFVIAVDDHLFYGGPNQGGIYSFFRSGKPICGIVPKPTGAENQSVVIRGEHTVVWHEADSVRYSYVTVSPAAGRAAAGLHSR